MSTRDRLLKKAATIGMKPALAEVEDAPKAAPQTSPGRMLLLQEATASFEAEKQILLRKIDDLSKFAFEVDIDKLVVIPGRKRKLTEEEYEDLKENLRHNDLVHPIVVRPALGRPGFFEIIAGHNRVSVYTDLGRNKILAINRDFDEVKAAKAAVYSNLLAPSLTDYEKFVGLRKIRDLQNMSNTELAEESGVSKSMITFIFAFERLPQEALEIIDSYPSRFGAKGIYDLTNIVDKKGVPAEALIDSLKKVVREEASVDQVTKALDSVKTAPRKPQSIDIKQGNKKLCTIFWSEDTVRLSFKDKSKLNDDLVGKIRKILEEA